MKNTWIQNALSVQITGVIDALQELGDVDIQRRLWNSAEGDETSSLTEAVERLFTDSGLGSELDKGCTGLNAKTVYILNTLEKALAKVARHRPPNEIIDDPAMDEVRRLAKEAVALLQISI
jgi:hypothetical protein